MKETITVMVLATVAVFAGYGEEPVTSNDGRQIRFSFDGKVITVSMVDNSAARSFIDMLPMTLEFRDYGGIEKVSDPPEELDTSDVPGGYDPSVGDLTLYAPWGNLAFFYRDFGHARGLVPLGSIVSGLEHLQEMDGVPAVRVELVE
jgi:hypothetical protein